MPKKKKYCQQVYKLTPSPIFYFRFGGKQLYWTEYQASPSKSPGEIELCLLIYGLLASGSVFTAIERHR